MGRPKGSRKTAPSYRRHARSGQAVVTLAGKDHYLGKFDSRESHEKYRRLVGEYLMAGRALPKPVEAGGASLTVSELLAMYVVFRTKIKRRQQTVATRLRVVGSIVRRMYGSTRVVEFGPLNMQALIDEFKKTKCSSPGREHIPWARSTINDAIMVVKGMFDWAVANELARPSLGHALDKIDFLELNEGGRETDAVEPADERDVDAVRRIATPMMSAMIRIHFLTGMRSDELLSMRPIDIDFNGPIDPETGVQVWVYRPEHHKTERHGKDRSVHLGLECQNLMRPYTPMNVRDFYWKPSTGIEEGRLKVMKGGTPEELAARRKAALKTRAQHRKKMAAQRKQPRRMPRERYFSNNYAARVSSLCERAEKIAAQNGETFVRFHPHMLRHAAGYRLRAEFGLEAAQVQLGHSHSRSTERYAKPDRMKAARAMARIG